MAGRGTSPGAAAEEDVVALLMRRHDEIREQFDAVEAAAGDDGRRAAFRRGFAALREEAESHARAEERYEFPPPEAGSGPDRRRATARSVRAAESAAPTRPYPAAVPDGEDAGAGRFAAVVDRARDARHGEGL
ncbi:hemerythrin domain-containing protein [Streptomyces sp. KL2]|uniref:hemerythrin domain-containing protein n=1 Tax=Streptomyces sp. KL2 TaxID=3050126 RepID=UPI003979F7E0